MSESDVDGWEGMMGRGSVVYGVVALAFRQPSFVGVTDTLSRACCLFLPTTTREFGGKLLLTTTNVSCYAMLFYPSSSLSLLKSKRRWSRCRAGLSVIKPAGCEFLGRRNDFLEPFAALRQSHPIRYSQFHLPDWLPQPPSAPSSLSHMHLPETMNL